MKVTTALVILVFSVMLLLALYLVSCTDTLKGVAYENHKPIVSFVNIPPEGQRFSRNPVVYWYGSDPDGLIDYYRYCVVTESEVGLADPADYILTIGDSDWTYVDVDPKETDPHTENVIYLEADTSNPVNAYVAQWVFLQAFDMEGLSSDIVFRLFSRNDHPPDTRIRDFSGSLPFVNSPVPGGVVTGVKMSWLGSDPIDYPAESPPFEYQWRLYGPYSDSLLTVLIDSFVKTVLVTVDAYVYHLGDTVVHCDTLFGDSVTTVQCDTVIVDPAMEVPVWGTLDSMFLVDDTSFVNDTTFNKVVDSSFDGLSSWIFKTSDTIYDVYKHEYSDTTQEKWFIFWVRSRDDAFVSDLTPAFDSFTVIDARYERGVGVLDFNNLIGMAPNVPVYSAKKYWAAAMSRWNPNLPFDTTSLGPSGWQKAYTPDYVGVKSVADNLGNIPMAFMLKHKVLILYDDAILSHVFTDYNDNIYKAIDAGVNVWATWRAPVVGDPQTTEQWMVDPGRDYRRYFGVTQLVYSAWFCHASPWEGGGPTTGCASYAGRIEDFVGAYAMDSINWPNLDIDTALLHSRYSWGPFPSLRFVPEHPGLPEVDWSVGAPATEVLYLYKSFYGPDHPWGHRNYSMEGNPVAIRLVTTLYKTAHFNFTPLAIDSVQMQQVINTVLDWLYPANLSSPTSSIRYPDAGQGLSVSEARAAYWRRCEEYTQEHAKSLELKRR